MVKSNPSARTIQKRIDALEKKLAKKKDKSARRAAKKGRRINPATKVSGWVKVKAVKIIRNKKGQAVSVKMKT